MIEKKPSQYPILFFDSYCYLCENSVQFILKRDRKGLIRFASLESEIAKQLLQSNKILSTAINTVILWEDSKKYTQSTAVLRVCRHLSYPWPLCYALIIIPPFLRNLIYCFVARNRYRWFGRRQQCYMPSKAVAHRFLS